MSMPSSFVMDAGGCWDVIAAARGVTGDMPPKEAYLLLFRAISGFAHPLRQTTPASVAGAQAAHAALRFLWGEADIETARREINEAEHLLDRLALADDESQAASPFGHSGWSARNPNPTTESL